MIEVDPTAKWQTIEPLLTQNSPLSAVIIECNSCMILISSKIVDMTCVLYILLRKFTDTGEYSWSTNRGPSTH